MPLELLGAELCWEQPLERGVGGLGVAALVVRFVEERRQEIEQLPVSGPSRTIWRPIWSRWPEPRPTGAALCPTCGAM